MRFGTISALLLASLLLTRASEAANEFDRWVSKRGALVDGPARARAQAVLLSLHPCIETSALRVNVLDSREVGAFAWPRGDLVVTTALLELLDDDELAAALAHEVGHLLSDGHLRSAALVGRPLHHESESAADEMGLRLLTEGGRRPIAMVRMIQKVQAGRGAQDASFQALGRRLELLQRTLAQGPSPASE